MTLILTSFIQSFGVFARMILPVLGIFVASILFWAVANMITLGYVQHISTPVTAAFIALFGMRVALSMKGDKGGTDLKFLVLYAVVFGIILMIAKGLMVLLAYGIAILATEFNLSDLGSFRTLADAEETVQGAFVLHAFSLLTVLSVIFLAAVLAAFAITMAAAARAAGVGASEKGFFWGFGRCFIPLFLICLITYVPQFVFGIISSLFAFIAVLVAFTSILNGSVEFNPDQLLSMLKGLGACAALLWLNAWVWSASALAYLSIEGETPKKATPLQDEAAAAPMDLRALRKQRAGS